ncbi:DHHA1 domain-containing protein [Ureaplasma sp. ES3154-GEN]|uniref:DHH family phosphoesterase n=1 Tax=Ureaplasma sp. ES3154-GEN TaxID=2984844 RepID=UPI0021E7CF92|nr:DHHA1 domain-containing protein [Ureaplasma sp. ES3154-GEN]MCV3743366.1 DHHA1 domain-containing protein [Ureaplasma sp. ES3154-GEN]
MFHKQNNNQLISLLHTFWEYIKKYDKITLCTHIEPDGDTLGSAVGLQELIRLAFPNKQVRISGDDYPRNLQFLLDGPAGLVDDTFFNESLKIVVDTSTYRRIYDQRVNPATSLKIDHHHEEGEWMFAIGGDYWPATGEPLVVLADVLNLKTNQRCLEGLATAILTDTEFLRERNISSQTFLALSWLIERGLDYLGLIKKLALTNEENKLVFSYLNQKQRQDNIDFLVVDTVVHNDIVRPLTAKFAEIASSEVCFMLLKKLDGKYRGEIRSKTSYDVSRVAKVFGGGGHFNSAGFIIEKPDQVKNIIQTIKSFEEKI